MSGVGFSILSTLISIFLPFGALAYLSHDDVITFAFIVSLIIFTEILISLYVAKKSKDAPILTKVARFTLGYCFLYLCVLYADIFNLLSDTLSIYLLHKPLSVVISAYTPLLLPLAMPFVIEKSDQTSRHSKLFLYGLCLPILLAAFWVFPQLFVDTRSWLH